MFFKVSLKKNLKICLHLYLALSEYHMSLLTADTCREKCYHMNRSFSNLKYEFFKENVSIFNVQYVILTGKGTSIRKTVRNYMFHFFFLSTTEYLILDKKIHRLEKNIRCGNTTELWKSNKSMKILCAFVILCKEMKIPGYTLRS